MTGTPALHVRELKRSFTSPEGDTTPIVDVPSLDLEAGEQAALQGGSGTGKTTLLNLVAGILRPDSGEIRVAGHAMAPAGEAARDRLRAREIGYVFQTFNLLQGFTALENVILAMSFGKGIDRAGAKRLLERVGLGHRLDYRPAQLSVGQQQRVAIARALANHPSLVLADEPTGNLDPRNAKECLALIREACREAGAALLLVSHDPDVFSSFDRRLALSEVNRAAHPAGSP